MHEKAWPLSEPPRRLQLQTRLFIDNDKLWMFSKNSRINVSLTFESTAKNAHYYSIETTRSMAQNSMA